MGDCHFMYLGLRVESDVALVVDGVPLHALLGLDLVEAGDRAVTAKIKKRKIHRFPQQKKFQSRFLVSTRISLRPRGRPPS